MNFKETLKFLNEIVDYLRNFDGNPKKRFNYSRFLHLSRIEEKSGELTLELIMNFQSLFNENIQGYNLKKRMLKNNTYLILEKQHEIPKIIEITKTQVRLLNDLIILNNNGVQNHDTSRKGNGMTKKISELHKTHPYLFLNFRKNFLRLSDFGIELSKKINSYISINKEFQELRIGNQIIKIKV